MDVVPTDTGRSASLCSSSSSSSSSSRGSCSSSSSGCSNSSNGSCPPTPLLDALIARAAQHQDAPFHVPGHKKGHGVSPAFQRLVDQGVLKHDLTEISGLDYLASPSGVIHEAQQLAAAAFSSDRTWFLVNGSSVGIHAAIMSLAGPGDTLMVARNCHQSAFAGMTLAGCLPWWLQPQVDTQLGIAHCVSPEELQQQLQAAHTAGTKVAAVLVVSPTYFGSCADVKGLARVCHACDVPLIVDEAHGAHFGLHPGLPPSAMQQGADVSIQSTHKVLSAMTQAAMLHVQGPLVDHARVSRALQVLQSSSPSYVLMASLDAARAHAQQPQLCFQDALEAAQIAIDGLAHVPGVSLLRMPAAASSHAHPPAAAYHQADAHSSPDATAAAAFPAYAAAAATGSGAAHTTGGQAGTSCAASIQQDPLRLTVCVSELGLTGYAASALLEEQFHVVPELATQQVVVFALGPGSTCAHAQQLVHAFQALSQQYYQQPSALVSSARCAAANAPASQLHAGQTLLASPAQVPVPAMQLTPRDAFFATSERVPIHAAEGRVSCELLCPYPPGVPVVYPGEVISAAALATLQRTLSAGGKVTGASDGSLQTLVVVAAKATV